MDTTQPLTDFRLRHEFFVGIDSDGSVFDTMAIKHRECLCPQMIECFGLQPVAQAACECMDFAGLLSRTRGANRHKSLRRILGELLPTHPAVRKSGFEVPQLPHYFAWVDDSASVLSSERLKRAIATATGSTKKELALAHAWNDRVNQAIERIVRGIPPFPLVRECLRKMHGKAGVMVVSTTPCDTLMREWSAQDLAKYLALIAGQEKGTKARHLEYAAQNRYNEHHVLMIGDASGDLNAARESNALSTRSIRATKRLRGNGSTTTQWTGSSPAPMRASTRGC